MESAYTGIKHSALGTQPMPLGLFAIVTGAGAWAIELAGTVYVCSYRRALLTVILFLGVIMLLPLAGHWIIRYVASVIGGLGAVVAVNQNFMGWVKISAGEVVFNEHLYVDPLLLSKGPLFIIIGQLWHIFDKGEADNSSPRAQGKLFADECIRSAIQP